VPHRRAENKKTTNPPGTATTAEAAVPLRRRAPVPDRPGNGRNVLLFDLDGTLVNSAPDLHATLNRILDENGRPPVALDVVKMIVGDGAAKMIERGYALTGARVDPAQAPALLERFVEIYEANLTQLTRPYPGVVETLEQLTAAGARCAVCSNKREGLSRKLLQGLDLLRFFEVVSGGDSAPTRKPHPGHLLHALAELGADPTQAVMVGDSRNDVAAAQGAGIPVIVVSYGYGAEKPQSLGADRIIRRFEELPAALAQLPA
jgi:phosphoglycolate phosphatase